MKDLYLPHLRRTVKLGGRKKPLAEGPHLKLRHYLGSDLPTPPASTNYRAKSLTALRRMYLNDKYGCCTVSAKAHLEGHYTGNASGTPLVFADAQIEKWYADVCPGFDPNDPNTDQGADMQTVLNYFVKHGFPGGSAPLGWVAVDLTNKLEVMQAIELFEGVDVGWDLPDTAVSPAPSMDGSWDFSGDPDPENGHDSPAIDYNEDGPLISTWGLIMNVDWADFGRVGSKANGGEGYILISQDMISKASAKAPNGFAWAQLVVDFNKMGGNLPLPPAPTPTPAPPASGGVSLAMAEAVVKQALANEPYLVTRTTAVNAATKALASLTGWSK